MIRFKSFLIIVFFLAMSLVAISQETEFTDNTSQIAKVESKALRNIRLAHKSSAGNNINLKYANFNWEIDPAVLYIKGNIEFYFKALQADVSTITLELNHNMIIDSIFFRNEKMNFEFISDYEFQIELSTVLQHNEFDWINIYY